MKVEVYLLIVIISVFGISIFISKTTSTNHSTTYNNTYIQKKSLLFILEIRSYILDKILNILNKCKNSCNHFKFYVFKLDHNKFLINIINLFMFDTSERINYYVLYNRLWLKTYEYRNSDEHKNTENYQHNFKFI